MLAMDVRKIPTGFGLKKLGDDLWEFRADLPIRVLFPVGQEYSHLLVSRQPQRDSTVFKALRVGLTSAGDSAI